MGMKNHAVHSLIGRNARGFHRLPHSVLGMIMSLLKQPCRWRGRRSRRIFSATKRQRTSKIQRLPCACVNVSKIMAVSVLESSVLESSVPARSSVIVHL